MAYSGRFQPKNVDKYLGDANNVVYRSLWELRMFKYCDQTPGIVKWGSEEFHIPYVSPKDGQRHRYFPDLYLEVRTKAGSIVKFVIEIKPKKEQQPPKMRSRKTQKFLTELQTFAVNQSKWKAAEAYCKERGWTFLVLNEDHIFDRVHR